MMTQRANKAKDDDDGRPRNLHLAIIGDSVSRFQYIALVYYLHYGRHVTKNDKPKRLTFKQTERNKVVNFTDVILTPQEECDCFRVRKWKPEAFVDNRYYYDPTRNNSVTFLLKYGSMEAHGHWEPADVHTSHELSYKEDTDYSWRGNWSVAFRHLAALQPKPKYVIFNAGHHRNGMYRKDVQVDIHDTLADLGLLGIYKRTTCQNGKRRPRHVRHEAKMCERFECINYDWTCTQLTGQDYYDHVHLKPHVNQRMNEELLQVLHNMEERVDQ